MKEVKIPTSTYRPRWLPWAQAGAWALLLSWLATRPATGLPPWGFPGADKLGHALGYAVLGVLVARALGGGAKRRARAVAFAALLALGHGALDEWRQSRTSDRRAEAADLAADVAGAAAGAWWWASRRRFR